jgi:hypothetical protein
VFAGAATEDTPSYVGGARVGGTTDLRAGLGGRGGPVTFDDMVITVAGDLVDETPPTATPSQTTTPTHQPRLPASTPSTPVISSPTAASTPSASPSTTPTSTGAPTVKPTVAPPATGRAVSVATSAQLTSALADARPGDVITMADGVYTTKGLAAALPIGGKRYYGTFVLEKSGTAAAPIVLQGNRGAVIDGQPGKDGTSTQYGLYLAGAAHVQVSGITVQNVAKGVVLDRSNHIRLAGLDVHTIGQEAIHLRSMSSDNVVIGNEVHDTGLTNATFGEGLYVGSANSNWGTYSDGAPDASDRNQLLDNTIYRTGAENIDIKEGTTGGLVRGNSFDGATMTGSWADSWIDLKGNGWVVDNNSGANALEDGFQVHRALVGWGNDNRFSNNRTAVNGPGYGFWLQKGVTGNVISCDNIVTGAAKGFATSTCMS